MQRHRSVVYGNIDGTFSMGLHHAVFFCDKFNGDAKELLILTFLYPDANVIVELGIKYSRYSVFVFYLCDVTYAKPKDHYR
ncbi:hypothetical protein NQ314_011834 [Rhamnusium bicolor]|uniref:Uncharacterized protein n=1 Tax=Rhamnusium bicolor TaxID=1586634 RepID=A0AAV8XFV6_9CUCU|nr:hypothetical protein NQ314_011834 [Rhamnusium bicolor]